VQLVEWLIVVDIISRLLRSTNNSYRYIPIIIFEKNIFNFFIININIKIYLFIIMWQFLCGFGAGVYVGTIYDCKPTMAFVKNCIKNFVPEDAIPKKKADDDDK